MKRLWLTLLAVVAGFACSADPTGPGGPSGVYEYRATDSAGTLLLIGRLDLVFRDDSSVAGTWRISWAPDADTSTEVGPQVGEGTLEGRLEGEELSLSLNPGFADHNVFLFGALVPESLPPKFTGDWSYSTILGSVASGHFTAVSVS